MFHHIIQEITGQNIHDNFVLWEVSHFGLTDGSISLSLLLIAMQVVPSLCVFCAASAPTAIPRINHSLNAQATLHTTALSVCRSERRAHWLVKLTNTDMVSRSSKLINLLSSVSKELVFFRPVNQDSYIMATYF